MPTTNAGAAAARCPPSSVAEGEHLSGERDEPVAAAVGRRRHAGDREVRRGPPVEPKKPASPNEKIPPSDATNQYPRPVGVATIATIGLFSRMPPVEP